MAYLYSDQVSEIACRVKRHARHHQSQCGQGGGRVVSLTVEMTCMRMTTMGGMSNQTMGAVEVVHLLATGMAHFWEEEDDHLVGHQAHLEVLPLT